MNARRTAVLCDMVGELGGTERYLQLVLPELMRAGFEVSVFARTVERRGVFGETDAVVVPWAGEHSKPSHVAAKQIERHLKRLRPAIVFTSNVFDVGVLETVRECASRWVARIHDHRPFCPNGDRLFPQFPAICNAPMGNACLVNAALHGCVCGPRARTYRRVGRRMALRNALKKADAILVSSAAMQETCIDNGIARNRIAITRPPLAHDAYGTPPQSVPERAVLFAGRLTPQKGLLSLVRAIAEIDTAQRPRLVVAGAGDGEVTARTLASRLNVCAEWLGWISPACLREAIDRCAAVVVPSLWPEPFGLVGIESQARGRPVIAYDVGGVNEWLDPSLAVARGNERQLASAILHALDQRFWLSLARAAFERAQNYAIEAHLQQIVTIFTSSRTPAERKICAFS